MPPDGFTTGESWNASRRQRPTRAKLGWKLLVQSDQRVPSRMKVVTWNLQQTGNGLFTLRLRMENKDGGYAERVIRLRIEYTPPTPEPTPIPSTETPTPLPPSPTPEPPTPEPSATP